MFLLKLLEKPKVPQHLLNSPKSCSLKWELVVSTQTTSEMTLGKEVFPNESFSVCFHTSCTSFAGTSGEPSDVPVGAQCFVSSRDSAHCRAKRSLKQVKRDLTIPAQNVLRGKGPVSIRQLRWVPPPPLWWGNPFGNPITSPCAHFMPVPP